ncbi:hypothetical protein I7I50_11110 [Histoplasma capsulatum G186AR]|uniref:Uncharacterized protein n=1 Tax=Ajellomyces capsulatus TaxID=5037 RepID=A0A8H7Z4Q8_AJECA|nr:hypothetical protein I7I52_02349 [Histoplasma capsulatum]QSS69717.1 hypothetical protein I7I50_11110 [Histoplasma capsulatum G186AR]
MIDLSTLLAFLDYLYFPFQFRKEIEGCIYIFTQNLNMGACGIILPSLMFFEGRKGETRSSLSEWTLNRLETWNKIAFCHYPLQQRSSPHTEWVLTVSAQILPTQKVLIVV